MADMDEATRKQIQSVNGPADDDNENDADTGEENDENTSGESDDESDDDDDSDDSWTPPTKEEFDKLVRSKQVAKNDARTLRARVRELEKKLADGDGEGGNGSDTKAIERARLEAENEVTAKFHGIIGRVSAKSALLAAGCKPESVAKVVKLIDFEDVEIDDNGEVVDGLEDQIEELKKDFSELFRTNRPGRRSGADGAPRKSGSGKPMSATDRQIAMAQGRL